MITGTAKYSNPAMDTTGNSDQNRWAWWRNLIAQTIPFSGLIMTIIGVRNAPNGLTTNELNTINNFLEFRFLPYVRENFANVESLVSQAGLSVHDLNILNRMLNEICVIRTYFSRSILMASSSKITSIDIPTTDGLSETALNFRLESMLDILEVIETQIKDKINNEFPLINENTTTVDASLFDFSPLVDNRLTAKYQCTVYTDDASQNLAINPVFRVATATAQQAIVAPPKVEPKKMSTATKVILASAIAYLGYKVLKP